MLFFIHLVFLPEQFAKDHCIVFTVDDAHFIDQYSWEFLNDLVEDSSTVCLLAIRPPSGDVAPPCPAAKKLISSRSTMHIKLKPLDGDHMAAMACQMLDVVRVPEELVRYDDPLMRRILALRSLVTFVYSSQRH